LSDVARGAALPGGGHVTSPPVEDEVPRGDVAPHLRAHQDQARSVPVRPSTPTGAGALMGALRSSSTAARGVEMRGAPMSLSRTPDMHLSIRYSRPALHMPWLLRGARLWSTWAALTFRDAPRSRRCAGGHAPCPTCSAHACLCPPRVLSRFTRSRHPQISRGRAARRSGPNPPSAIPLSKRLGQSHLVWLGRGRDCRRGLGTLRGLPRLTTPRADHSGAPWRLHSAQQASAP